MEIAGKKFLVIGGAGFIGSHIVEQLLEAGAEQVCIYDNFTRGTIENIEQALTDERCYVFPDGGDILHKDILLKAMQGVDGVFHLAALWLLQCAEYPRSAFDVNVTGTMNVVECAARAGVKRLVFSSSASVYGNAVVEPMPEDHPFNCQEFYGASKVCGEMLINAYINQHNSRGEELSFLGLRYMNVYGPRQDEKGAYVGVITRMLSALDRNEQPEIHGDGSQSYDFVDVRDCARANLAAMVSDKTAEFYNVGTGVKTSIRTLVQKVIDSYPSDLQPNFIQMPNRPYVNNRVGNVNKIEKELGFKAKVTLELGLKDLVNYRKT